MRPERPDRWWIALLVFAIASTWISPFARELFVGDETKYGRVVYEMVSSGEWLVPTLEGEPYAHKPPVHFWVLSLLSSLFGLSSIWTYVLPSLVFFPCLACLTAVAARRIGGLASGVPAAAIFASFWLVWISAQTARMDLMFVTAITAGVILLFDALESGSRLRLMLAGLAFGVGVLVKGPMAAVIGIVLYLIELTRRSRSSSRVPDPASSLTALVITLAVPLAWLLPAIASGGAVYGEEMLIDQSLGRAFQSWVHAEPPWFYIVRFPMTFFPWFLLVILGGLELFRERNEGSGRGPTFLLSWFAAVFIPFSLVSGKLDVYMLPAMIPAAVLAARYLETGRRRTGSIVVTAVLGLLFAAIAVLGKRVPSDAPELTLLDLPVVNAWLWLAVVTAAAGIVLQSHFDDPTKRSIILGIVALVPLIGVVTLLIPVANDVASSRPLVFALERTAVPPSEAGLYWTPHLWTREMDPAMHGVRYDEPVELIADPPRILIVRRDHSEDLASLIPEYERIDELMVIWKTFDVYERSND